MKALVFYDDSAFAARASSTLQRVGHRSNVHVRWMIKTWEIYALHDAVMLEKALLEGADAHLIVIPGRYARSLPAHLRDWLERWAVLRRIEDAAVGVVGDAINSGLTNEVGLELRSLIKKHGLKLITKEARVSQAPLKLFVGFSMEPEQPLHMRLAPLLCMTMPNPFRAFGIND